MDTFDNIQEVLNSILDSDEEWYEEAQASLEDRKHAELVQMCKDIKIPYYGNKSTLVKRLLDYFDNSVIEVNSTVVMVEDKDDNPVRGNKV